MLYGNVLMMLYGNVFDNAYQVFATSSLEAG